MADTNQQKKGKGGGKPQNNENTKKEAPKADVKPQQQQPAQKENGKQQQPPQKEGKQPQQQEKPKNDQKNVESVKESKKEETQPQTQVQPQTQTQPQQPSSDPTGTNANAPNANAKPKKPQREYERGKGTVKAVSSGDSFVVIQIEKNKPPQEKEITLSNILAPKLARRNKENKSAPDEEFAFASREFLRKAIIGKNVTFTIESSGVKGGRQYGIVYLISKDGKETDLAQLVVSEGWAKVRRKEGQVEGPLRPDVQALIDLEDEAKKAGKGVHTKNVTAIAGSKRPALAVNTSELYERFKSAPVHGVVERVISGSILIVTLLPTYHEVKILLSGVECPQVLQDGTIEAFSRESKFLTEYYLLNRDVQVILEGADKFTLYGTLDFNGNNISEELLKKGYAKFVEWSGNRTAFAAKLKAAEKHAQTNKLGIWGAYTEPKQLSKQDEKKQYKVGREILGKVTAVVNSGLVTVIDGNRVEHQISLSSIVVPRGGNMRPKKKDEKSEKDQDNKQVVGEAPKAKSDSEKEKERRDRVEALERTYAWEGKEYLRRRIIGQKVRCVLDYNQPPPTPQQQQEKAHQAQQQGQDAKALLPDRNYFSVYLDKNNVAVELVAAGLALPRNHRGGEPRSKDYEDILKAETIAKKAGKGRFYPEERASVLYINDISQDAEKARAFLPSIKRTKQRGVVVHVFNAGKFKVYVPKESCELTLSVSALKTPRSEEPFANESTSFIKERVLQRDIEFDVSGVDRGGNFVGNAWVNRENIAVVLLAEGFAKLLRGIAQDSEFYNDLDISEETAKKNRKNLWKDYDEVAENELREKRREENLAKRGASNNNNNGNNNGEFMDVIITEILDANTFFVQIVGDEAAKLEDLMTALQADDEAVDPNFVPKNKDLVKAQYIADDQWYRANITGIDAVTKEVKVFYIDYGNSETVPASRIKPLAAKFRDLKPQASQAHLAFVKPPAIDADYGPEAAQFLKELVEGKTMMANVEYRDSAGIVYLSLGDRESQVHVNAALVRAGLSKVKKPREYMSKSKQAVDQLVAKLREEEDKARSTHSGIWEYGDPGSDEDDDTPKGKFNKKGDKAAPKKSSNSSPAVGKKEEKKDE